MSRGEPPAAARRALEVELGCPIGRALAVSGGDIAAAFRIEMQDETRVFVKAYDAVPADLENQSDSSAPGPARCEARGLEWLRTATSLRVPQVLAHESHWLALEWIESSRRQSCFESVLGRGLAKLHATRAPSFGLDHANWIGRLPQANDERASWDRFYAEVRLQPMIERAAQAALLPRALRVLLDELLVELPSLIGPDEEPSRLHGDLWSGNVLADESGLPCLIDPAIYGGHREIDLAMLDLFGGLPPEVERAYHEAFPLAPGAEKRRPLYQVYPLLVHVCLFGQNYLGSLESACRRALVP